MLDPHAAEQLIATAACAIELPEEWSDYFEAAGPTPPSFDESRRFPRFHFRRFAVLGNRSTIPALPRPAGSHRVFLKDISRSSVAFLHSEQLFPCECPELFMPDGSKWLVTVTRCLRHKERCYEVAATFSGKPATGAAN